MRVDFIKTLLVGFLVLFFIIPDYAYASLYRLPEGYTKVEYIQAPKKVYSTSQVWTVPINLQENYNYIIEFTPLSWEESYYGHMIGGNDRGAVSPKYHIFKLDNGFGGMEKRFDSAFWNYDLSTNHSSTGAKYRVYTGVRSKFQMHCKNYDRNQGAEIVVENEGYATYTHTSTIKYRNGYSVQTGVYDIPLFTTIDGNTASSALMQLHNLIVEDKNGNAIYDYVPCVRDYDSKAGLYDVVNGFFYYPSAFTLVAGPVIFETANENVGMIADAIDLGLSVKWASWNVGASKISDYGGLYGAGDPTGLLKSSNYKDYHYDNVLNSSICGTEYDIAKAKWGDHWRMPTMNELKELTERCTWQHDIWMDGIRGSIATGPSGNQLFIPYAGCRIEDSSNPYMNKHASLWSGEQGCESDIAYSYSYKDIDINYEESNTIRLDGCFCWYGQSVRPVYVDDNSVNTITLNNVEYSITSSNSVEVRSFGDSTKDVFIPESISYNGKIYRVTSIGGFAFYQCRNITSVTIPSSVTLIGSSAFEECTNLTSVTLSNGLTSIGGSAFEGCSRLSSITIPSSVTSIALNAFKNCSSLKYVSTLIQNPFEIQDNVFYGIPSDATLTVPDGRRSAYLNTSGWNQFKIIKDYNTEDNNGVNTGDNTNNSPDTPPNPVPAPTPVSTSRTIHVATAGTLANLISEDEKYQIEKLTLTGELNGTDFKLIREMAGICIELDYTDIPRIVKTGTDGKLKSLDISDVEIKAGGPYYYIKDKSDVDLYEKVYTVHNVITYALFAYTNLESIVLPANITGICQGAFAYTKLTSLTIPEKVTSIGGGSPGWEYLGTFEGCANLKTIDIPYSVTTLSSNAFSGSSITSITIPNSVTSIGNSAFSGCTSLTHVTIPHSVTTIGDYAFKTCTLLHSVTIPNSVANIGIYAFSGCYLYTIVSEIEKPFELKVGCFDSYTYENASLTVPKGTKSLYKSTVGWRNFLMIGEASGNDEPNIAVTVQNYTREYGEKNPIFEYMIDGVNLNGTPTITCEATKTSPVGIYAIKISKGSITNDNVSFVNGTLTITKAPLTVTAKNYSRKQGQANPTFELAYSGFKNGETESVLTRKPTVSTTATISSAPGLYDIIVSGGDALNYSFIYKKGVLTVTEKDEVLVTIEGITYQGTKSTKTVMVTSVDNSLASLEIPASISYDGMTYQVIGIDNNAFKGCNMASLVWDVDATLPNNTFSNASIGSNFLLYVKSAAYAPSTVKNVVVDGTAQTIVLSDNGGQFYCPQTFIARNISYTHNYTMETGGGKGWEALALPFFVQKITHSTRGEIVPFALYSSSSSQKPFWLGKYSGSAFKRTSVIEANVPYIIAMPNNSKYRNEYNLAGEVTFSAENAAVPKTPSFSGKFLPAFAPIAASDAIMALNNSSYPRGSEPGSTFFKKLRDIHPFEAYMTSSGSSRGVIEISFDDGTTDLDNILLYADEGQEITIHTLSGLQVAHTNQCDFDQIWLQLPKGVYIVNGKKMIK